MICPDDPFKHLGHTGTERIVLIEADYLWQTSTDSGLNSGIPIPPKRRGDTPEQSRRAMCRRVGAITTQPDCSVSSSGIKVSIAVLGERADLLDRIGRSPQALHVWLVGGHRLVTIGGLCPRTCQIEPTHFLRPTRITGRHGQSSVSRLTHNPKVAGSNPVPATKTKARKHCVSGPLSLRLASAALLSRQQRGNMSETRFGMRRRNTGDRSPERCGRFTPPPPSTPLRWSSKHSPPSGGTSTRR